MTIATIEKQVPSIEDKLRYADVLAKSGLLPEAFRRQPANVLVAIEYGEALGIRPIVALSEINVINGKPSLSASLMASLARQAGHKVRTSSTLNQATCTIIRADDPGFEHTVVWDEQRARSTGLWDKGFWKKDPQVMLEWRAIAACVRKACPEVLAGIRYTPEEVAEFSETGADDKTSVTVSPAAESAQPRSLSEVVAEHKATDWLDRARHAESLEQVRTVWQQAKRAGATDDVLDQITEHARSLDVPDEVVDKLTGEVPVAELIDSRSQED